MRKSTLLILLITTAGILIPGFVIAQGGASGSGADRDSQDVEVGVELEERDVESPEGKDEGEREVWTIAVLSDMNGSYGSTSYNQHVHRAVSWIGESLRPDMVVSPGDMIAGQRRNLDYRAMWASFHEAVTDPLAAAGIPMAVTPGNHDASGSPAFWEERIHFAREWKARKPRLQFVEDSFYPFYYAFELGPALFISLDGTQVGPLDRAQREWVGRVLRENRHKPVKVVFSHVPLFSVAQGRENEFLNDRELEALFIEEGVDMMITGHHHAYYPGKREETVYLHAACLGDGPRALIGMDERSPRSVSVVRFDQEGIVDLEAYLSPEFEEKVELESLPETIGEGDQKLWRIDAAPDLGE